MKISKFEKVLLDIAEKLNKENVKWKLTGSSNLFLQGIKYESHDLDIILQKEGAKRFCELFKEHQTNELKFSRTDKFASIKADFNFDGIDVEVMADLEVNVNGNWIKRDIEPIEYKEVILNKKKIILPLISLEEILKKYKDLNREKDQEKIKLIEQFLNK